MEIDVQASDLGHIAIYGDDSISTSLKNPTQLVCLLTMNDQQVFDVTKYAKWSLSNTDIAVVNKKKVVTGDAAGDTTI
jgi:hypothetical protein